MDASSVFDPVRSLDKSLKQALTFSELSFSGHVDAEAYFLALRTYFSSQTGLRLSPKLCIGGSLALPTACVQLLPPTLVPLVMRHLARGVPEAMYLSEFHRDSYFLVTNERIDGFVSGRGAHMLRGAAEDHRPKSLPHGALNTLAVGRFLAELLQLPYDCPLTEITRALRAADEIVIRSVAGAFDVPCPG